MRLRMHGDPAPTTGSYLGDLRAGLSPKVRTKVMAEVPKDLTKTPDAAVVEHLGTFQRRKGRQ
jgi:protein required for attachment to host cells